MATPHRLTVQFWDHATAWTTCEDDAGHATDGGRVFGITRTRYAECARYGCSPVAVIAYEDREQVEDLADALQGVGINTTGWDLVQAALREFVSPAPPKPDEPTGLGAVVEDTHGLRWIRWSHNNHTFSPWRNVGAVHIDTDDERRWADIAAVRVLSEGIQP